MSPTYVILKNAKQKQTHWYRKQTCGYQGGEGSREGPYGAGSSEVQTVKYKTGYKMYYIPREIQPIVYNKY